jgi:uncharacterized YccA/Bax inhibitor family protein
MMSQKTQQKRYGLFVMAIVLLLSGGAALFIGPHDLAVHSASILAIIASAYLVRVSHIGALPSTSATIMQKQDFIAARRPRRLTWAVGIGLLLALAASYVWMRNDAMHGGQSGLPAYVFGGLVVSAGIVWGYLFSRLRR